MLDLETLSTHDGAAILSIGAVRFAPFATKKSGLINTTDGAFHRVVNPRTTPLAEFGFIDYDTMRWWMKNLTSDDREEREAAQRVFEPAETFLQPLRRVLEGFSSWFRDSSMPVEHIWANGASFDFRVLAQAYARCGLEVPWRYGQERDFRTLKKNVAQLLGISEPTFTGVPHDAFDDAAHQAGWAITILRELKKRR
jgi:DNA polymerase III epsilon subunit-like protein